MTRDHSFHMCQSLLEQREFNGKRGELCCETTMPLVEQFPQRILVTRDGEAVSVSVCRCGQTYESQIAAASTLVAARNGACFSVRAPR